MTPRSSFQSYLDALPKNKGAALEKIRVEIRKSVPDVEEYISYGMPAFRLNGRLLAALGSHKEGCSLHIGSTLRRFSKELEEFSTSKGTIRFSIERPLPAVLVRKLIRARVDDRIPKTA